MSAKFKVDQIDGLRFHYFGNKKSERHGGIVAAAALLVRNDNKLRITFAYCSPKDRFSRDKAHRICVGRLNAGCYVVRNFDSGNSFNEVVAEFNSMPKEKLPVFCRRWGIDGDTGTVVERSED